MKLIYLVLLFLSININLFGQQENDTIKQWHKGALITVNFSQTSLSNWASGGQSSISELNQVNLFANYKRDRINWDNTLDMAYGIQQRAVEKAFKTDDKIDLASKYGYQAFDHTNYTGLLTFKSQFAPGYNLPSSNKISDFLAPAYLGLSIGLDYKPSDNFTVFLAPFSNKTTIVNNQALANEGAFGVEKAVTDDLGQIIKKGEKIRYQYGAYFKMMYKKTLMENVAIQTKLDLFSDYIKKPENIDVYWDVLLNFKINKFLSASIATSLIYDNDIKIITDKNNDGIAEETGPRTQFKEILAIGIAYKF